MWQRAGIGSKKGHIETQYGIAMAQKLFNSLCATYVRQLILMSLMENNEFVVTRLWMEKIRVGNKPLTHVNGHLIYALQICQSAHWTGNIDCHRLRQVRRQTIATPDVVD